MGRGKLDKQAVEVGVHRRREVVEVMVQGARSDRAPGRRGLKETSCKRTFDIRFWF